jgi:hypothetical protein
VLPIRDKKVLDRTSDFGDTSSFQATDLRSRYSRRVSQASLDCANFVNLVFFVSTEEIYLAIYCFVQSAFPPATPFRNEDTVLFDPH